MPECPLCEDQIDHEDGGFWWELAPLGAVTTEVVIERPRVMVCEGCSTWLDSAVETVQARNRRS